MAKKKIRHVMGLSGGKDSTGLAILLHDKIPDLEYFFCDTHKELPETYEYLDRIKARLGIKISYLSAERGFDHYLDVYGGLLPSPRVRWCTRQLKLFPFEKFVGDDEVYSYIGIRGDEDRDGYISTKSNINPVYPYKGLDYKVYSHIPNKGYDQAEQIKRFRKMGIELLIRENGYDIDDVKRLLQDSGIGLPDYYRWRSRSGCYFCFFQRKYEWVRLSEEHPDLFEKAIKYEKDHSDGRNYSWLQGETLSELIKRKDKIIAEHDAAMKRTQKNVPNKPLADILASVLDDENDDVPCLACNL